MSDRVLVPNTGTFPVAMEEIQSLNGAPPAGAPPHAQKYGVVFRTGAFTFVDAPGDATYGADIDIRRMPHVTPTTTLKSVDNTNGKVLAAANAARAGLSIFNYTTANLYIKYDDTSATPVTAPFKAPIGPGEYWEMPPTSIFPGVVMGIWDAGDALPGHGAHVTDESFNAAL